MWVDWGIDDGRADGSNMEEATGTRAIRSFFTVGRLHARPLRMLVVMVKHAKGQVINVPSREGQWQDPRRPWRFSQEKGTLTNLKLSPLCEDGNISMTTRGARGVPHVDANGGGNGKVGMSIAIPDQDNVVTDTSLVPSMD
jgi:hypothetical protein